ncbi:hypothetical protein QFC22_001114 [Naganishia vaughanmartiniae]|uniref:Uncharacterized protein n=1 Tax=Naganishia vaughanmartiniae TaxID=1424756 RepID=A0ACC2XJZ3_9TREE|nr:hypothetical protein QFC22_001114 [Naganishia vaughanmartiniae]
MSGRYDEDRSRRHDDYDRRRVDDREPSRKDRYDDDRRRDDDRSRRNEPDDRKRERSRSRDGDRSHRKRRDRSESRERSKKKDKKDRSPSPHSKAKAERKAAKAAKKREEELQAAKQIAELNMYTAEDNPFHDANLGQQFQWHKKRDKEKKSGITDEEAKRREQARRLEAKEELERLNKRRAEREVEMQLREEEDARLARLAESAQMADWIAKEDDFLLEQSRRRAGIRMKENRAKAIDFLAINLRFADPAGTQKSINPLGMDEDDGWGWEDAGLEFEIDEPWLIFENLTLQDTEELEQDIRMYLSLEKSPTNKEFWEDPNLPAAQGQSTNAVVESDIARLLEGKSFDQLVALENNVKDKLASREPIDVDYWEGLLRSLQVWKAKSKLHQIHVVVIKNRLEQLRQKQRQQALKVQEELGGTMATSSVLANATDVTEAEAEAVEEEEELEEYSRDMSPELLDPARLPQEDRNMPIVDEEDELRALFAARRLITSTTFVPRAQRVVNIVEDAAAPSMADLAAERLYKDEAAKNLDEDEEFFNLEEGLDNPGTYSWEDKFRPRKPRFFNRVHTGFEWNKYNQTHYEYVDCGFIALTHLLTIAFTICSTDNPPPKVVQGYKFNIFYPDLIDKTVTPSYKFIRSKDDPDTCLLVFTAGPPYEDIAFRIVDKEWEYSHKRYVMHLGHR